MDFSHKLSFSFIQQIFIVWLLWLDIVQWAGDRAMAKTDKTLAPLKAPVCLKEADHK